MKNHPSVNSVITNNHFNEVGTVVHAEWQMNRFYNTVADNTPSEDDEAYDIEYFPIESITENNRPTSGICKAIVGQAVVDSRYHDTVPSARYYTIDADDEYTYWQSPKSSDANGLMPLFNSNQFPEPEGENYNYDNLTSVRPYVSYVTEDDANGNNSPIVIDVNKITFTIENTFARPTDYDIQIRYTIGGPWVTVATDIVPPANGKVELWYDGTDWTTTKNLNNVVSAQAVRLVVRSMNKRSFFNLIELGLCLERNLTADLISWDDRFTMGENDFITPLGNISTNTGSVVLWNGNDGTYRNNNESSLYHNLLDKGVIFRCWTKYGSTLVQEFEMFSDTWDESDDSTTVSLIDGSSFFMETKPRPVLYRSIPVQEAIWRICDIVGFNNYNVTNIDRAATIDIFWTDGEKTAWEIFGELSRATQTAIYFDSYGVLQVKTRGAAWNSTKTPDYEFIKDSIPGGKPSNIVNLSETTDYEANKVTVNWRPTGFSEAKGHIVPFQTVWEPEGSVVLRATELARTLPKGHTIIQLETREGKTWPWNGVMNLEGEYISWNAKTYIYYDANGVRRSAWVEDYDEQKAIDAKTPANKKHLNHYTGALRVEERGLWGSEDKEHRIDLAGWSTMRKVRFPGGFGLDVVPCGGIRLNRGQSSVTITSPKNNKMTDYTYLHRGNGIDAGYKYLGMRMRVNKSAHKDKCGGIFFAADAGMGAGYYLEVTATAKMNGKARNRRNEVVFYSMKPDGTKRQFGGQSIRLKDKSKKHKGGSVTKRDIGARLAVPLNRYIDFDIWFNSGTADHKIQVFANGQFLFEAVVPDNSGWKNANVSRMGLYVRGHSSCTFDYVYGINSPGVEMVDSESYFDRIDGGYYSTQAKDWTFDTRTVRRKVKKRKRRRRKGRKWRWKKFEQRYRQRFFEEFGPIAHEIREFDVKFESDTPVLESRLYFSNESQAVCTEYTGDISGATFTMANIKRGPAIIHGDDERTSMGNGSINHKLFVYGRPVIQKDAQSIIEEDGWAVRRRGIIEVEYSSNWIQNEDEAKRFAKWLTTHWSRSDSTLEVEVFGNPLIELADVVTLKYDHIDAKFYVVGIGNTYENGLTTTLSLRKVHNS